MKRLVTISAVLMVAGVLGTLPVEAQTAASSTQAILFPAQTALSLSTPGLKRPRLTHWGSIMNPREPHPGKTVLVGYVVGTDGHTHNIHILKGQGRRFDLNAMLAVAYLRYRPGSLNGATVAVEMTRKIDFLQVDGPDGYSTSSSLFGLAAGPDMKPGL